MNGMSSGAEASKPEMNVKEDLLSILKGLEREEIEDILSQTFCYHCQLDLHARVQSVANRKRVNKLCMSSPDSSESDNVPESTPESSTKSNYNKTLKNIHPGSQKCYSDKLSLASVDGKHLTSLSRPKSGTLLDEGLSEEQKEMLKLANVGVKKNFVRIERVNGKNVNVLQGLELHTRVFSAEEQKKIVESVYKFQRMGQKGQLRERTYTEPTKWMRGKGRVTIQFGCCYNYAVDKNGNPPGIVRDEEVDPLPPTLKQMIKRLIRWHVLPSTCVPNSCIVNIYEEGDCIPPHIDHHDFLRPFCTVSFLTECNILFGSNLKILGPGEFGGPVSIPLPIGSVLVLNGNGADIAKHCIPAVPAKRISITFRKMDESKIPYRYSPDEELQGVFPLLKSPLIQNQIEAKESSPSPSIVPHVALKASNLSFAVEENDFPPLGVAANASRKKNFLKA